MHIVCDCCGDTKATTEMVERISRQFNVSTDNVYEALYDDKAVGEMPRMVWEGCHVERLDT